MNNSEHTSGPWEKIDGLINYMPWSIRGPGARGGFLSIAHIDEVDGFHGSSEANARLIAAAPDLLEALRRLLDAFSAARDIATNEPIAATPLVAELQTAGGAQLAAEQAIAKATGES
jgi:hypothetical protein